MNNIKDTIMDYINDVRWVIGCCCYVYRIRLEVFIQMLREGWGE